MPEVKRDPTQIEYLTFQCMQDSERWFGDTSGMSLPHMVLALCGETGELANIVKKIDRGSLNRRDAKVKYDMAMELADIFTYLLNIAALLGIDLVKLYDVKRQENDVRFMKQRKERDERRNLERLAAATQPITIDRALAEQLRDGLNGSDPSGADGEVQPPVQ